MIQRFFVATVLPNLNDMVSWHGIRKGKWSKYSEAKTLYDALCKADIRQAKIQPVTKPVHLLFVWQERNRRRDKDNICAGAKFVLDALVSLSILSNDGWNQIATIQHEWVVRPKHPGVWVQLEEV